MGENGDHRSEQCLATTDNDSVKEPRKTNLRITSVEDAEHFKPKERLANGNTATSNSKATRNTPRRHTVGGPRSSKEILGMQTSEMDKKREAFLEHLKQKYPHHASAIMGHQERLREQARSPKLSQSLQPGSAEQAEKLSVASGESVEAMSEGELPSVFMRGSRSRASLPVVRSANQTKDRSLGVLYLQYGDDTKQIKMPNEITSTDTIRALFVSAFPQQLSMKMLESPSVAIYIKDEARNVFYELSDIRNIQDRALLKVYNKDPAFAFNHTSRAMNGDLRMQREVVYTSREGPYTHRQGSGPPPPHSVPHMPPQAVISHSVPPSPSRIPFGGGRPMILPGNGTMPRERVSSVPSSRSISPSPSAILERRDVKPDEDLTNKNVAMMRNEGLYADPYMFIDGRMSMASSHSGYTGDVPDHLITYHRNTMRPPNAYPNAAMQTENMEQALYRQRSRKYVDSHLPTLGSKTPPSSPHRVTDMRVVDVHSHSTHVPHSHTLPPDQLSPVHQVYKKDPVASLVMETTVTKTRNTNASPVLTDVVDKSVGYTVATAQEDTQTRGRMEAMEQQIASLTGLVQSALLKGSSTTTAKDVPSEKRKNTSSVSRTESGSNSSITGFTNSVTSTETTTVTGYPQAVEKTPIQVNVHSLRQNILDLRLQLQQMRQLQLQNQETLRTMIKKAEREITGWVTEAKRRLEDPVQQQRTLVEEERQKYLLEEERIVKQLCDLESLVDDLKKESTSAQKIVTLKDVEDGAYLLRQVGEELASLKGEFPALQNRMRAVLRVEVEAVKFLKEEPHKLDSLLKRVKNMTEVLNVVRRYIVEGPVKSPETSQPPAHRFPNENKISEQILLKTQNLHIQEDVVQSHVQGQLSTSSGIVEPQSSSVKSQVLPTSNMVIHHVQSAPVVIQQSQQSLALSNSTPGSPTPANQLPDSSVLGYTAHSNFVNKQQAHDTRITNQQLQPLQAQSSQPCQGHVNGYTSQNLIEEFHTASSRNRAMSIEAAEKEWAEKRQRIGHYDDKEFEKLLQEAQTNMMKSIPSLEVAPELKATQQDTTERPEHSEETVVMEQEERALKSPPPPPPRRSYLPGSGLTTGRSGEVIYTIRKEATLTKECEEEATQAVHMKAPKTMIETKISPPTPPPPVAASAIQDEDDEGDKIMAELQSFQKCTFVDVSSKPHAEPPRADPQVKEVKHGTLLSPKEKKQNLEFFSEDSDTVADDDLNKNAMDSAADVYTILPTAANEDIPQIIEASQDSCDTNVKHITVSQVSSVHIYKNQRNECINLVNEANGHQEEPNTRNEICMSYEVTELPTEKVEQEISKETVENKVVEVCQSKDFERERDEHTKHIVRKESIDTSNDVAVEESMPTAYESVKHRPLTSHTFQPDSDFTANKQEILGGGGTDQVVLRSKKTRNVNIRHMQDISDSSPSPPTSPTEEIQSADNIAFMITETKVQVLSSGEVNEIVKQQGEGIQTVNIDGNQEICGQQGMHEETSTEGPVVCVDKKPVIIIFDEPMDIRAAYKRLSTIFEECDEELEKMMSEATIVEENEELESPATAKELSETSGDAHEEKSEGPSLVSEKPYNHRRGSAPSSTEAILSEECDRERPDFAEDEDLKSDLKSDASDNQFDSKQDAKKKFKFKFPKKQLAALTQAIRTGTKTGKKTLQVVVYEDEEEPDGTVKQHKEAKRFEITRTKSKDGEDLCTGIDVKQHYSASESNTHPSRSDEIRKNTYKTLDSLEQTIKELETTISEMNPNVSTETRHSAEEDNQMFSSHVVPDLLVRDPVLQEELKAQEDSSSMVSIAHKGSNATSSSSRMPVPMTAKVRPQGSTDKPGKQQKLQDSQRQFRQANGSTKKAGGDCKPTSPTVTASKIPAFSPTSGKSSSMPAHSTDNTNPPAKSSIPSPTFHSLPASRTVSSSSHIPSVSNGSVKLQNTTYTAKGHHLSFSPQAANGRPSHTSSSSSSSHSSHSPVSPTSLNQGMKNIRTIHTPSFTSSKTSNGTTSKSSAKETS
ncbi:sickle tail protein homolog isoform X3 [Protopterus annectens]|uniref:sickle tail protein homolog isoform X3 n=1 Tax=Protopterus annectens TaxID=7888 RepID=UPI001CFBB79B|nr:sickle tail protein homolog isoform X3 [Protopterus annectens]